MPIGRKRGRQGCADSGMPLSLSLIGGRSGHNDSRMVASCRCPAAGNTLLLRGAKNPKNYSRMIVGNTFCLCYSLGILSLSCEVR